MYTLAGQHISNSTLLISQSAVQQSDTVHGIACMVIQCRLVKMCTLDSTVQFSTIQYCTVLYYSTVEDSSMVGSGELNDPDQREKRLGITASCSHWQGMEEMEEMEGKEDIEEVQEIQEREKY